MTKNPLNQGIFTENSGEIGPVTEAMVRARARALAVISGRDAARPTPADEAQARREFTGGPSMDAQDELLDALPESKRWDPVPGSRLSQIPVEADEDEDDDGRSETAQLVDEGASEAERDKALRAARAARQGRDLRP